MELDAILKQGMSCGSQNVRLKASSTSSIWMWVEVLNPRPTPPNPSKAAFKQDPHVAMDRPADETLPGPIQVIFSWWRLDVIFSDKGQRDFFRSLVSLVRNGYRDHRSHAHCETCPFLLPRRPFTTPKRWPSLLHLTSPKPEHIVSWIRKTQFSLPSVRLNCSLTLFSPLNLISFSRSV